MKLSLLDWITFGVLFGIFVWLVLKMVGIINTPDWLLYAPLYGAVFAAGSFYYKVVSSGSDIKKLRNNFEKFKNATINKIHNIELNCVKKHG